jgi:hypothetical protein
MNRMNATTNQAVACGNVQLICKLASFPVEQIMSGLNPRALEPNGNKGGLVRALWFSLTGVLLLALVGYSEAVTKSTGRAPDQPQETKSRAAAHEHDFDWKIGDWNVRLKRLLRPLTDSTTWQEFEGTAQVRKCGTAEQTFSSLNLRVPQDISKV